MIGWLTAANGGLRRAQLPDPIPAQDEVAVAARSWAFNNADLETASDEHVAGYEFSGEVVAVGSRVDPSLVGRAVMGTAPGAFAQVLLAHHRHVVRIPEGVSFEDAAALPTALLTEHGAMCAAGFSRGGSMLITGATSSIGLVGVQIARALGASRIIASSRSASRHDLLIAAGADVAVTDIAAETLTATEGAGVDVVLDHVGGDTFALAAGLVRSGGTVVNVGRLSGPTTTLDLTELARSGALLRSVSFGFADAEVIGGLLDGLVPDVLPAVAAGRVRAVIDSVHAFDDAPAGLERLRSGGARGKVVLTAGH